MISEICLVILPDWEQPNRPRGKYDHPAIINNNISINKEHNKQDIHANIYHNEFPSERDLVIEKLLVLEFEDFLKKPEFKQETGQKISTSRNSNKIVICVLASVDEVLPEYSKVPHNA